METWELGHLYKIRSSNFRTALQKALGELDGLHMQLYVLRPAASLDPSTFFDLERSFGRLPSQYLNPGLGYCTEAQRGYNKLLTRTHICSCTFTIGSSGNVYGVTHIASILKGSAGHDQSRTCQFDAGCI